MALGPWTAHERMAASAACCASMAETAVMKHPGRSKLSSDTRRSEPPPGTRY
jgi:hypothetical protein